MTAKQRINKIQQAILNAQPTSFETLLGTVNKMLPHSWGYAPRFNDKDHFKVVDLSFYDGKNNNHVLPIPTNINVHLLNAEL